MMTCYSQDPGGVTHCQSIKAHNMSEDGINSPLTGAQQNIAQVRISGILFIQRVSDDICHRSLSGVDGGGS